MLERELTRETGKHSLNAILPKDWAWKRVPDSGKRVNSAGFDGWLKHIPSGRVFVIEVKLKSSVLTEKEREVSLFLGKNYCVAWYSENANKWNFYNNGAEFCIGDLESCLNWLLRQP